MKKEYKPIVKIDNTSEKFANGKEFISNSGEKFVITGKTPYESNLKSGKTIYPFYVIKFGCGNEMVIHYTSITNGYVKNPFRKRVYGYGFIGYGKHRAQINKERTREYTLWMNMMERCYSEKYHKKNPTYKDCACDPRWHNYQNFCEDLPKIDNYNIWLKNENKMNLDKDVKIQGNKIYSLETCVFLTPSENIRSNEGRWKTYLAKRLKDNYIEGFNFIIDFSNKYNISCSHISDVIQGRLKSTKGWIFWEYKREKEYIEREKELLRVITLTNRRYKKLENKYMKLKKDKQVEHLKQIILKREKEIKKLRERNE